MRNMVRALVLVWVFGGLASGSGSSIPKSIRTAVDWPSFLARSDPVNTFQISAPHTVPDVRSVVAATHHQHSSLVHLSCLWS